MIVIVAVSVAGSRDAPVAFDNTMKNVSSGSSTVSSVRGIVIDLALLSKSSQLSVPLVAT